MKRWRRKINGVIAFGLSIIVGLSESGILFAHVAGNQETMDSTGKLLKYRRLDSEVSEYTKEEKSDAGQDELTMDIESAVPDEEEADTDEIDYILGRPMTEEEEEEQRQLIEEYTSYLTFFEPDGKVESVLKGRQNLVQSDQLHLKVLYRIFLTESIMRRRQLPVVLKRPIYRDEME